MSDAVYMDTKHVEKYLKAMRVTGPKFTREVMRGFVNTQASTVREKTTGIKATVENGKKKITKSRSVLKNKFSFKNDASENFTNRGITFDRAKRSEKSPSSVVGAMGSLKSTTVKGRKASYLARQELGGKVTQIESGGGKRRNLMAPAKKGMKKLGRVNKSQYAKASGNFGGNKKRQLASALANARTHGKKRAFTPFGIYKVTKRAAVKLYGYHKAGSIKTQKRQWLKPATKFVTSKRNQMFKNEMDFRIKDLMDKAAKKG